MLAFSPIVIVPKVYRILLYPSLELWGGGTLAFNFAYLELANL